MNPTSIIMKIKAQNQGDIKGDLTQTGREGYIKVLSINHEVILSIDPNTIGNRKKAA
jgi:type VI protein secretion system component Hcp